jgi:hypothetical protein
MDELIKKPVRWDGDSHHVFGADGQTVAYLLRNTHREDYELWDEQGEYITKCINEHESLASRVKELEAALREYANPANWAQNHDGTDDYCVWAQHGDGYDLARKWLEENTEGEWATPS